ncbi:hypothetical protein ACH54_08315, partial [Salmonella enterica subsp. enterica serovar Infantis]
EVVHQRRTQQRGGCDTGGHPRNKANLYIQLLLAASKSAQTPVGVVKSAGRKKEEKWLTTLGDMDFEPVDMTSLVIVGNKTTYVQDGLMITPRGYVL